MHPKRGDDSVGSWAETRPSICRPEWGALVNEIWLGDGGVPALAAATLTCPQVGGLPAREPQAVWRCTALRLALAYGEVYDVYYCLQCDA